MEKITQEQLNKVIALLEENNLSYNGDNTKEDSITHILSFLNINSDNIKIHDNKIEEVVLKRQDIKGAIQNFESLYKLIAKGKVSYILEKNLFIKNEESNTIIDDEIKENIINYFDTKNILITDSIKDIYDNPDNKYILSFVWKKLFIEHISFIDVKNELINNINKFIEDNKDSINPKNTDIKWKTFLINLEKALTTIIIIKDFISGIVCDIIYSNVEKISESYIFNPKEKIDEKINPKTKSTNLIIGPDIESYKGIPFYATHIWEQTKQDIMNYSVTFGKNLITEDLITNTKFLNPKAMDFSDKTLLICGGSGSGKGVLGLVIVANALRFDMPIVYLDCKPDMARTLFNITSPQPSLTIDGLSELGTTRLKAINREIENQHYLDYAKSTFPKEFYEFIGEEKAIALVNALAYTKTIEMIVNFINSTSQSPTSYRPLFIIDEVQNYSEKLWLLMYKGRSKDILGGAIGDMIQSNSNISSSIKNYFLQLQNWIDTTWLKLEGTYSASYRQANFSLMCIFQEGAPFKNYIPAVYKAVKGLAVGGSTLIYGRKAFKNGGPDFTTQPYISVFQKSGLWGNNVNQEVIANELEKVGLFVYVEKGKPIPLKTCLIVNDGIENGKLIKTKEDGKRGNLYNTFSPDNPGINNIIIQELFGKVIPEENIFNEEIPKERQVLDFNGYADLVLNYKTPGGHTIQEKMTQGFEKLKTKLLYYGDKQDFFEQLYDFNPQHMGIASENHEFINNIVRILTNNDNYRKLYSSEKPIINIIKDDSGNNLINSYTINLPENSTFLNDLENNGATNNLFKLYQKQLNGECQANDAAAHEPIFKALISYLKENNIDITLATKADSPVDTPFMTAIKKKLANPRYDALTKEGKEHIKTFTDYYELSTFGESCQVGQRKEKYQNQKVNHNGNLDDIKDFHTQVFEAILSAIKGGKEEIVPQFKENNTQKIGDQNSEQKIIDIFDSKIGQNKDNLDSSNTGYLEINANTNINGLKDDKAIPIEMFGKEKAYNGFMTNWNKSTLFFKGEGQYKEAKIYKNISIIKRLFNDRFWKGLKEQKISTKDINTLLLSNKHIVVNGKIFGSKDYYTLPIPGLKPSTTFNFNNGKFFGCKNLIALQLSNSMWKKLVNDCYIDLNESLKGTADLLFKKFKHLEQLQIVSDTETTTITRDSWKTYNYSNNNLDKAYNIQQYQEALDKGLKAGYDVNNTSDVTQLDQNNKKQKEGLVNKFERMMDDPKLRVAGSVVYTGWRIGTAPIRWLFKGIGYLILLGTIGGVISPSRSYRNSYGFGGFGGGMMGAYGGRRGFGSTRRMGFGNRRLSNTRRTNRRIW